jgi:hypothetical protein
VPPVYCRRLPARFFAASVPWLCVHGERPPDVRSALAACAAWTLR